MMLLFKKLNFGKFCIIADGEVFVFDKTGKCTDEKLPVRPEYMNGALKMNYISVVSSGKRLEVAIFNGDTMKKFTSSMQPQDCVMKVFSTFKCLCFLRRNGKAYGVSFNQAVFVYIDTIDIDRVVEVLQLEVCE